MADTKDFLFEIGTEELPPKDLEKLSLNLTALLLKGLETNGISHQNHQTYATPRRIAVLIKNITLKQPEKHIQRKGPSIEQAFDNNNKPTKAALGFARSCNTEVDKVEIQKTKKGSWLYFEQKIPGRKTLDVLPEILKKTITSLPISKRMRWGKIEESFVRPVHWLLALLGNDIIPVEMFNIKSSNISFGHRFMSPGAITITHPDKYEVLLEQNKVIPNFIKRKQLIEVSLNKIGNIFGESNVETTPWLLQEVTALVEFPVILEGKFSKSFLALPKEVLVSAMEDHQRCFPIADAKGKLLPKFLLVSNLQSKNQTQVIAGNERVIDARLKDALFYYKEDQKQTLEAYTKKLKNIIYQKKLGTLQEKVERISAIAMYIANKLGGDNTKVEKASSLAKADLLTQMVYEFPELQGIAGYYYALNEGIDEEVAVAIKDHYLPNSASSALPSNVIGLCVSIADKLDSLVGLFGINKIPTGEKDPFALRRQALGIIRILMEKQVDIDLKDIITYTLDTYKIKLTNSNIIATLIKFFMERMKNWYQSMSVNPAIFSAATIDEGVNLLNLSKKIVALKSFALLPEATTLTAANKRVKNILEKNKTALKSSSTIDQKLLVEPAEKALFIKIDELENQNLSYITEQNYSKVLNNLTRIGSDLDNFFNNVMVMCEDEKLKTNRLILLKKARELFLSVGDVSMLPQ